MSQTKQKIKSARRLHDQSKRKTQSNRVMNLYKEFVVDDESGNEAWWLWATTELGDVLGKKSLDKIDDATMMKTEEGEEWTIPHTPENVKKLMGKTFGATRYYSKDHEVTLEYRDDESVKKAFLLS